jgi:rubredoxin
MSEQPFNAPRIVGADGRPIERPLDPDRCPECRAGREKRMNAAGFGPPRIVCSGCGYLYEGATE